MIARTRFPLVIAATIVVALFSGCSAAPPTIQPGTASELQASVLAISTASAEGNIEAALAQLDELEALVREGTASGTIAPTHSARIQAALQLVRADLLAARPDPAPDPAPKPAPEPAAPATNETDSGGHGGNGNENKGNNGNKGNKGNNGNKHGHGDKGHGHGNNGNGNG